ncbi:MAG: VWA domain-containing protein [Acidobacteriota bacterium]|nr:VWA domain-containing protein [Acidobacteriota bacterium]
MTLRAFAVALSLAVAATILGQDSQPPKPQPEISRPDAIRKLSKRERKQRLEKLPVRHQEFAEDVEPIMLPAELDMFLSLPDDTARDTFADEFWRRRDHVNRTSGVFKDAYYRRLERAKEMFKRVTTDRARLYLLHGPPAEVVRTNCQRLLQPVEVWKYNFLPGLGHDARLMFYKPRSQSEYRLWNPLGGSVALAELVVAPEAVTQRGPNERNRARDALAMSNSPYASMSQIQLACTEGAEIIAAITQMVQARIDLLKLFEPPELNQEDVRKMLRSVIIANPTAPKLTTEVSVRFPTKEGSRTDVQLMLLVPRDELSPAVAGEAEVYTIDVTGEVLRDGELWEKYRYRFDFPAELTIEKFPIVIDRFLRPAEYVSRVKVTDANTGAEAVVEMPLIVPEIFVPETLATAEAESAPAPLPASVPSQAGAAVPAMAQINEDILAKEPRLRIIPPSGDFVSGLQTIDTILTGEGIKAVEFWMDGRKLAIRRSPPYALDLDFGIVPQMRRIRAVALDARDQALTGDELTVNTGTDPFRVRIVSPRVAPRLTGSTRVEMDVNVPDGDELASLELYYNETRVATLYDTPFVQTIELPAKDGAAYLRAVATLKDASVPPVEDVVIINTPAYMEELNVHLIELPTTVIINGKPADSLTAASFKILDEGKPVAISKFDYVKDLPLSIGLAIDASGSMLHRMVEAQKAGAQFFEKIMRKGDKGFIVAFDKEALMIQKWSTKVSALHAGLAKLRAEETTALYDALVFALYNFHGVRGQKALVLISDGKDTASKFTFEQSLEYARRTGVPIFSIGIGIRAADGDVRYKLDRLSRETGGTTFYIEQASELQRVYDGIQAELRSQYVLGFYPAADIKPGSKWREVTVQATEGKVRTIKGYFP